MTLKELNSLMCELMFDNTGVYDEGMAYQCAADDIINELIAMNKIGVKDGKVLDFLEKEE